GTKTMTKTEGSNYLDCIFPQSYNSGKSQNGYVKLTLCRNTKEGNTAKVISQYGHQVVAWGSPTVSVSPSPAVGITFCKAYDKTAQQITKVKY
ncbi:MAG: hypothetical protein K6G40_06525, partial [Eubacterium sp.]|nr:hypothetical protein [Eubacterium sp.]